MTRTFKEFISLQMSEKPSLRRSSQNSSISRYRGTWNPVWMDNADWLQNIKVNDFFEMYQEDLDDDVGEEQDCNAIEQATSTSHGDDETMLSDDDDDDPDNYGCGDMFPSHSYRAALGPSPDDGDDDGDGTRRLLKLFFFSARAIILGTPWDADIDCGDLSKKHRKVLLGVLLHQCLDRTVNPVLLGRRMKEVLKKIQREDTAANLFSHHVSFMTGTPWELKPAAASVSIGRNSSPQRKSVLLQYYDHYRNEANFYGNTSNFREFREDCDKAVEKRLHLIQQDLGRAEAKATKAIEFWHMLKNSYQGVNHSASPNTSSYLSNVAAGGRGSPNGKIASCACFGNHFTIEIRELRLEHDVLKEDTSVAAGDGVAVLFVDPKQGLVKRTQKMPKNVDITVSILFNGQEDVRLDLPKGREKPVRDLNLVTGEGMALRWPRTVPLGFFLGDGGRSPCGASIHIEVRKQGFLCGAVDGDLVAIFDIPLLDPMYHDVTPFNHADRDEISKKSTVGIHFKRVQVSDVLRGVSLTADTFMNCMEASHNERPPPIDVLLEEERRRLVLENIRDDIWKADHHKWFRELSDVLGELDDNVFAILRLYADRYLIHDELRQCALLYMGSTKTSFDTEEHMEMVEDAVEGMMECRGTLQTKVCAKIVDEALAITRRQATDRLVALEDATVPPMANLVMEKSRRVLSMLGVSPDAFATILAQEVKAMVAPSVKKLSKLANFISISHSTTPASAAAMGYKNAHKAQLALMQRMSIMPELESLEDKELLVSKARLLCSLCEEVLQPLTKALEFAELSKSANVIALAACRTEAAMKELLPCFESCVSVVQGSILRDSVNPDPLSDTCGMLVEVLSVLTNFAMVMTRVAGKLLQQYVRGLVQLVTPFFPLWVHLCREKQTAWTSILIEHEPLDPVAPGKIFYNQSPADALNLLESLHSVFLRVFRWSDPNTAHVPITAFVKIVTCFVENLCLALVSKCAAAEHLSEKMVALCTYCRLGELLEEFWAEVIVEQLIDCEFQPIVAKLEDANAQRDILFAECTAIKADCVSVLVGKREDVIDAVVNHLYRNFLEALSLRMENAELDESRNPFLEEGMRELQEDLRFDLLDCIGPALPAKAKDIMHQLKAMTSTRRSEKRSTSAGQQCPSYLDLGTLAPRIREKCTKALYSAFKDFAIRFAVSPLTPQRKQQLMGILQMLDEIIRTWIGAPQPKNDKATANQQQTVVDHQTESVGVVESHKARTLVLWLCHSSSELILICSGDTLLQSCESGDSSQRGAIHDVLKCRKDKEAIKFSKNSF